MLIKTKNKEMCVTQRWSVRLSSKLDCDIFNKWQENYFSPTGRFSQTCFSCGGRSSAIEMPMLFVEDKIVKPATVSARKRKRSLNPCYEFLPESCFSFSRWMI